MPPSQRDSRPVLLCSDGSDHAAEAIRHSSSLLGARPAIVLHVGGTASSDPVAEEGRRLAVGAGFHPVSIAERATGPVADAILAEAESRGVAAIVVGSRGLSGIRSTILGSVSSRLAHHARRPLLVVRPGSDGDAVQAPAFLCFEESSSASHAVATAGTLLANREAIVANFQPAVDDVVVLQSTLPWPVGPTGDEQLAAIDRDEAIRPVDVAAYGAWLAERAGFEARSLSLADEGIAWRRLSEAADAEGASCIVVGHRRDVDASSQLGSTAYGLVQHANRPVLVVPLSEDGPSRHHPRPAMRVRDERGRPAQASWRACRPGRKPEAPGPRQQLGARWGRDTGRVTMDVGSLSLTCAMPPTRRSPSPS